MSEVIERSAALNTDCYILEILTYIVEHGSSIGTLVLAVIAVISVAYAVKQFKLQRNERQAVVAAEIFEAADSFIRAINFLFDRDVIVFERRGELLANKGILEKDAIFQAFEARYNAGMQDVFSTYSSTLVKAKIYFPDSNLYELLAELKEELSENRAGFKIGLAIYDQHRERDWKTRLDYLLSIFSEENAQKRNSKMEKVKAILLPVIHH